MRMLSNQQADLRDTNPMNSSHSLRVLGDPEIHR